MALGQVAKEAICAGSSGLFERKDFCRNVLWDIFREIHRQSFEKFKSSWRDHRFANLLKERSGTKVLKQVCEVGLSFRDCCQELDHPLTEPIRRILGRVVEKINQNPNIAGRVVVRLFRQDLQPIHPI